MLLDVAERVFYLREIMYFLEWFHFVNDLKKNLTSLTMWAGSTSGNLLISIS